MHSPYENTAGVANVVTQGRHRDLVGGNWDALGTLQLEFLLAQGLLPNSYLLDIGAGCLRGGVRYAEYLAPGHYFGVDAHQSLLDAGYDIELAAAGLRHKVPRSNLLASESFEFERFNRRFDFAIAQSLFTHLPLNNIRLCLAKLAAVIAPGGKFFATFFERPADLPEGLPCKEPKSGTVTYSWRDPYHYRPEELSWLCTGLPWRMTYVGEWGHPSQRMLKFEQS